MSTSKKVANMAAQDASEWARAEMFFGEGAGTRRKLLRAALEHKMESVPDYKDAFVKAYESQDFAEHAIKAAKERKRLDRGKSASKNVKALIRGDKRNLTPVLFAAVTVGVILHDTGYDKVLLDKAKVKYRRFGIWMSDGGARDIGSVAGHTVGKIVSPFLPDDVKLKVVKKLDEKLDNLTDPRRDPL